MNARRLLAVLGLLGATSCAEPGAGVSVYDVGIHRQPDATVVVTANVVGFERSGRSLGEVCTSVHFLPAFFVPEFVKNTPTYGGAIEEQRVCRSDLEDGSVWSVRFASAHTDIPRGALVRVQVFAGGGLTSADGRAP